MKCLQLTSPTASPATLDLAALSTFAPDLVLVFSTVDLLAQPDALSALYAAVPAAAVVGCSTAGEISGNGVGEKSLTVTGIRFDRTTVRVAEAPIAALEDSYAAGVALGRHLAQGGSPGTGPGQTDSAPAAILLFGRGTALNGTALIDGLAEQVGPGVPISGGLAGDDGAFQRTLVVTPGGVADDRVVAVGLYGDALRVGNGSYGGWQAFGPLREITRADGNVLYTLDDEPALDIYRRYLGDHAEGLPASGLLFPFEMVRPDVTSEGLIRTILGIDDTNGSLILAGAVTPGHYLRMMHASTDSLILGAEQAADHVLTTLPDQTEGLALLVSCVGRKLVMGDRVDEEIEAVIDRLETRHTVTGFYSYGEINPQQGLMTCKLHNQTMTIAVLTED